eukprot:scaffold2907_cov161-Amphora_coffeaeformis.AAC.12
MAQGPMAKPNERTGMGAQLAEDHTCVTCRVPHDKRSGGMTWARLVDCDGTGGDNFCKNSTCSSPSN